MRDFFPNYFFIGALIVTIFLIYFTVLLFRIPERSAASRHLSYAVLGGILFNLVYVVIHVVYGMPLHAVRLVSTYIPMAASIHLAAFFLSFPAPISGKKIRNMLIVAHLVSAASAIYLGYEMSVSGGFYLFNGQFWDSDTLPQQKRVGMLILASILFYVCSGVWRGFKEQGSVRYSIWIMVFGFALGMIPGGILNLLSRDNLVPRSVFITVTVIGTLVGYFISMITYLNVTKDRTPLLGRITGIAFLSVLLILQAVSYYWMRDAEQGFDALMYSRAREGYKAGELPENATGMHIYERAKKSFTAPPPEAYATGNDLVFQAESTYLMHELSAITLKGADLAAEAKNKIAAAAAYAPVHSAYLSELVQARSYASAAELVQAITGLHNRQLFQLTKLRQMKPAEVNTKFDEIIRGADKYFPGIRKYFASLPQDVSVAERTQLYVQGLTPWRLPGTRLYRGEIFYQGSFPVHFIAYHVIDAQLNRVVEVSYPYIHYRRSIAAASVPIIVTILVASLLIIFGFTFFFRGALMQPINDIMTGLKEINNSNYDTRVPIHVEDELGFMARNFNKMARSIKAGRMSLQKYAEQLEQRVEERTQELQSTLKEVQELKSQQDGDYFLTTLLLKPLGINEVDSRLIGVESLVRQYKRFAFRHWTQDIGGDINISHMIELQGRRFLAFINADAMGKSMQGAGGALVLGSVFHTIIERTQATREMREHAPERWLKNAFIELHRVFESFDGSMLVSGFFGLLDETAGLLYHVLAEHPRGVIFREGKAGFIENDRILRKLGTPGVEGTLVIATTQIEPGDILFIGSDGRDDIILGMDAHGGRIINEDENLFLRLVEEAEGSLTTLIGLIEQQGEIMDDLSVMRIERYREEHAAVRAVDYRGVFEGVKRDIRSGQTDKAIHRIEAYLKEDASFPDAVKNLSQLYYQVRNYEKAAHYAQQYLALRPVDAEFVFFAARCFRRVHDYRTAIDFAERLRLREQPIAKNLALLTDLHLRLGNVKRAQIILAELVELDPATDGIDILKSRIAAALSGLGTSGKD